MKIKKDTDGESKRRFSPVLWAASLAAIAVLVLGLNGTLAQFVSSITNTNNKLETAGNNTFGLQESNVVNGNVQEACVTAGPAEAVNCLTINKFGDQGGQATPMAPGTSNKTVVQLKNTATQTPVAGLSGNLVITALDCSVSATGTEPANTALCGTTATAVTVEVECSGASNNPVVPADTPLGTFQANSWPVTMAANGGALAPQGTTNCTFTTTLPRAANTVAFQNQLVTQHIRFTLSAV